MASKFEMLSLEEANKRLALLFENIEKQQNDWIK